MTTQVWRSANASQVEHGHRLCNGPMDSHLNSTNKALRGIAAGALLSSFVLEPAEALVALKMTVMNQSMGQDAHGHACQKGPHGHACQQMQLPAIAIYEAQQVGPMTFMEQAPDDACSHNHQHDRGCPCRCKLVLQSCKL